MGVVEDFTLVGARGEVSHFYAEGIGKSSRSFEAQSSLISKPAGGL
jgi:hypothetical protein